MATSPTQIRIDERTKQQAIELLDGLGLNLSDAVNMFLKQVILQKGIPFEVRYPETTKEATEAAKKARQPKQNPNAQKYSSFSEALEELDDLNI